MLLSSNRFLTPSSLLPMLGCIYYDMKPRKQASSVTSCCLNTVLIHLISFLLASCFILYDFVIIFLFVFRFMQVSPFCTSVINCCTKSNPCLNGGTCLPPLLSSEKRFRCNCPDNFEGDRCEHACISGYTGKHCDQKIRSCRGYGNGTRVSGNYTVFDDNNSTFEVFCDFDRNTSMSWTLIQSYTLDNNDVFTKKSLIYDYPQNQKNPSWSRYRLSKSRMESIQQDSTKWRITCRYETDGVVYTDYLRALNTELNILKFKSKRCAKMEYLDVRGQKCTDCIAFPRGQDGKMLHIFYNNESPNVLKCDFRLLKGTHFEIDRFLGYYFGHYYHVDTHHRCSSSGGATTQIWFGA